MISLSIYATMQQACFFLVIKKRRGKVVEQRDKTEKGYGKDTCDLHTRCATQVHFNVGGEEEERIDR